MSIQVSVHITISCTLLLFLSHYYTFFVTLQLLYIHDLTCDGKWTNSNTRSIIRVKQPCQERFLEKTKVCIKYDVRKENYHFRNVSTRKIFAKIIYIKFNI